MKTRPWTMLLMALCKFSDIDNDNPYACLKGKKSFLR
jgi:hypothetical protein